MGHALETDDPADLPGEHASLWIETTPETTYDSLAGDLHVETAVVGGGIAGITAAVELAEAGRDVALLEADRVVEAVTGHTTAKLTTQHGKKYASLVDGVGRERAQSYAAANQDALRAVAERVDRAGIDCDFERQPAYLYARDADDGEIRDLERESRVARELGLPATYVEETPLPFDVDGAVRFDDQARFHPRKYLLAVAERLVDAGGSIYEQTRVTDVDPGGEPRLETDAGTVQAEDVILATHFPILDRGLFFARATPFQSHVLGVRLADEPPEGLFFEATPPNHSLRSQPTPDGDVAILGGEGHRTGHGGSTAGRYRALVEFAREQFDVDQFLYHWTTQDFASVDGLPFVGPAGVGANDVYVATGFGGWGMTNGVAAGRMLADRVLGRGNHWADAFDPRRFTLQGSASSLLDHNASAVSDFVGDWVTVPRADPADLEPGEGRVLRHDGDVLAAHRDEAGDLHAVSGVCTHLGCLVTWNDGESTWDCPCHGSRFAADGDCLDGPATRALPDRDVDGQATRDRSTGDPDGSTD